MSVKLSAPVRVAATGEVTTIAALAAAGRIRWTTGYHTGRKRGGERRLVRHYRAELIDSDGGFWPVSKAAYLSRTGQDVSGGMDSPL